jgi:Raf kinase inhibitor-like YbhB/YbcL family protein
LKYQNLVKGLKIKAMRVQAKHPEATTAVDYKYLKVSSAAFDYGEIIPEKYTCDGENISPPLDIENIPEEAKCMVLIVDDPDAPVTTWVHWLVWDIPVTHHIQESEVHGVEGLNDFEKHYYGGPCPPSGTHRYFFKVYALDTLLNLPANTKKIQLEKAMSDHIIAFGELVGLYSRKIKR